MLQYICVVRYVVIAVYSGDNSKNAIEPIGTPLSFSITSTISTL